MIGREIIESNLTPFVAAAEVGAKVWKDGDTHRTKCPNCGSDMLLLSHDFRCVNDDCVHKTVTSVEFLADFLHGGDIPKAMESVGNILTDRGGASFSLKGDKELISTYRDIRRLRGLFRQSLYPEKRTKTHSLALAWARKNRIDGALEEGLCALWTRDEMEEFRDITNSKNLPNINKNGFVLAIPYFTTPAVIGAVLFFGGGMTHPRIIRLETSKYCWAGLNDVPPGYGGEIMLTQNFSQYLQHASKNRVNAGNRRIVAMLYQGDSPVRKHVPRRAMYLFEEDDLILSGVSALAKDGCDLSVLHSIPGKGLHKKEWEPFVIGECFRRISKSQTPIDLTALQFVDSCGLTHLQEKSLMDRLIQENKPVHFREIKDHFSTRVIYEEDKCMIRLSPSGYLHVDRKTGRVSPMTNFVIQMKESVAFQDRKELMVHAQIIQDNISYPILFDIQDMEAPATMEQCIRKGWMSNMSTGADQMPVIKDRINYKKYLSRLLKDEASDTTCVTGVSSLGWNYRKTLFQGPGWYVGQSGYARADCSLHPDSEYLKNYEHESWKPLVGFNKKDLEQPLLSPKCMEVMRIVAGYLAFSYHSRPILAQEVQLSSEDYSIIQSWFRSLGQVSSPDTHHSKTGDACKGFPSIAQWQTKGNTCRLPFLLPVGQTSTTTDLPQASQDWFHCLFLKLVQALIDEKLQDLPNTPRVSFRSKLLEAGDILIQKAIGATLDQLELPYESLEKVLKGTTKDDIGERVAMDYGTGKMALSIDDVEDPATIMTDLQALGGNCALEGKLLFTEMGPISGALSCYYESDYLPFGRISDGEIVKK